MAAERRRAAATRRREAQRIAAQHASLLEAIAGWRLAVDGVDRDGEYPTRLG